MVLKRESVLFARDEKGELIPQEVTLEIDEEDEEQKEYKDETIIIVPICRGEIKKLFAKHKATKDTKDDKEENALDAKILDRYLIEPRITFEEVKDLKPSYLNMIVSTILAESGLTPKKTKKEALEEKEDEFGKNSDRVNPENPKAI